MEVSTPVVSLIATENVPEPVVSLVPEQDPADAPDATVDVTPEDPIKMLVAAHLKLASELYSFWDIVDKYPAENSKLVMVHYNKQFDRDNRLHEPLKNIRGVVVDLETGAIIADSFGYTENMPCYEPLILEKSPGYPQGVLRMMTTRKLYVNTIESNPEEAPKVGVGYRDFDMSQVQLFPGYEGVLVRVFLWHGQTFFSTYKKIDATGSFWGSRMPYFKIYQSLGGPELKSLFGPEEQFSPYCHFFLITDNQLRLASSTRDNRLFYLGVHKVWDETVFAHDYAPYMHLEDFQLNFPKTSPVTSAFSPDLNHGATEMSAISVDLANKWAFPDMLVTPFPKTPEVDEYKVQENELVPDYDPVNGRLRNVFGHRLKRKMADDRLAGGDFLIMYVRQADGSTRVYRVDPPGSAFRAEITNNNPVFYNQFVVKTSEFHKASPDAIARGYPELRDDNNKPLDLSKPEIRLHYWHSLFYRAVPPSYKKEVENYDQRFNTDIQRITDFIAREVPKITDPEEQKRIGNKTHGVWHRFLDIRSTAANGGRKLHFSIQGLLRRENGVSLYKMIGALADSAQYRTQLKEKQKLQQTTPTQ